MKRIYYIDWLRIFAIAGVFIFHNSHFFDPVYWHIKNPDQNEYILLFLGFFSLWLMPLFFFLSGASSIFGLNKTFSQCFKSKTTRLLVPFVIGVIFLIPPQKYVEALSNGLFSGNYLKFLSSYFGGEIFNHGFGFNPVWIGIISYHLWFLGHLYLIHLLSFGVLKYLNNKGKSIFLILGWFTSFRGGAILMFIPIALLRVILKKQFPEYTGWCDLAIYFLYFLYGYFFTKNERLKQHLVNSKYIALFIGVSLYTIYILSFSFKGTVFQALFQDNTLTKYYIFQESVGALATWSMLIFIISLGIKYLNKDHTSREALNEAVLPFYILHQTIMILVGYWVVQWSWSSWYKFGFIAVSSLFLIATIYLLAIKPFNFMRFIFGMNNKIIKINKGGIYHENN